MESEAHQFEVQQQRRCRQGHGTGHHTQRNFASLSTVRVRVFKRENRKFVRAEDEIKDLGAANWRKQEFDFDSAYVSPLQTHLNS